MQPADVKYENMAVRYALSTSVRRCLGFTFFAVLLLVALAFSLLMVTFQSFADHFSTVVSLHFKQGLQPTTLLATVNESVGQALLPSLNTSLTNASLATNASAATNTSFIDLITALNLTANLTSSNLTAPSSSCTIEDQQLVDSVGDPFR